MDDKQLQKLIRQNAAKVAQANKVAKQRGDGRRYDPTLPAPRVEDADLDREFFFKEMKRREF